MVYYYHTIDYTTEAEWEYTALALMENNVGENHKERKEKFIHGMGHQ